jgi:hypothetical protein
MGSCDAGNGWVVYSNITNTMPLERLRMIFLTEREDLISETHVWIDQQGLVVKARIFIFSPQILQNRSPVDLYYSDYRQMDGFLVPFHISREIAHHKDSEIVFDSIDVKAKLSEADFQ